MNTNECLFPLRLTRRDFIKRAGAVAAGLAATAVPAPAAETKSPACIGSGAYTYELVEDWGQLPAGMRFGLGCGVVVDSKDRVYVTSRWTSPTDVAVAANGDIYVVDGYGSQRVSRFDKNFKHIKTIGERTDKKAVGPNAPHGTFNTCHGVWINTLKNEPEIFIADRHNDRIEVYSLELNYERTLAGDVRNPCCFYQHKDKLYVPDLASRVTILDADGSLV